MSTLDPWLGDVAVPVNPGGRPAKKRTGRMRKMSCGACGFIAYTTAGAVERAGGLPTCGCGGVLELPNLRDRAAIEWETLEAELAQLGRADYRAALREIGERAPAGLPSRDGSGAGRKCTRCCACSKFTNGRPYCPEHDPFTTDAKHYADRRGV